MENRPELNIDIATYQKAAEQELDFLRKENFSLKIVIAQLQANIEALEKNKLDQPSELLHSFEAPNVAKDGI